MWFWLNLNTAYAQRFFCFKSQIVDPKHFLNTISFGGEDNMKIFHPSFFISLKKSLKVMVNIFPKSVIPEFIEYAG